MEDYGRIIIHLEELIQASGLSKNKVSQRAEMQRTQLNNYCKNEVARVDLAVLARLCHVLGVGIDELLEYRPPETESADAPNTQTNHLGKMFFCSPPRGFGPNNAAKTHHKKTTPPPPPPGRRLRADVLLIIDAASAYSVRLFHHKVLHRDAVALDSLGIQYPVAAVFKKRARRDGGMGGQPVCAAAGFELVAEGRGNPLPLAVLVDIEPVEVTVLREISKADDLAVPHCHEGAVGAERSVPGRKVRAAIGPGVALGRSVIGRIDGVNRVIKQRRHGRAIAGLIRTEGEGSGGGCGGHRNLFLF